MGLGVVVWAGLDRGGKVGFDNLRFLPERYRQRRIPHEYIVGAGIIAVLIPFGLFMHKRVITHEQLQFAERLPIKAEATATVHKLGPSAQATHPTTPPPFPQSPLSRRRTKDDLHDEGEAQKTKVDKAGSESGPPIVLHNSPGSAVSIGQQGGMTVGTLIVPQPPRPTITWTQEVVSSDNALSKSPRTRFGQLSDDQVRDAERRAQLVRNPGVLITAAVDGTWTSANFAVECDHPCDTVDVVLKWGGGFYSTGFGMTDDGWPVVLLYQPTALPPHVPFKWEIHSKDSEPVHVKQVQWVNIK